MPLGFSWGMPPNFVPKGYQPVVKVPFSQPFMFVPPPVVHATPYLEEPVFHVDQSESVGVYQKDG